MSEPDEPAIKVVHVVEAHRCAHCGAVCPSCLRTDERLPALAAALRTEREALREALDKAVRLLVETGQAAEKYRLLLTKIEATDG